MTRMLLKLLEADDTLLRGRSQTQTSPDLKFLKAVELNPAEQADACEEASCADSQETSDLEQNPAVDSTENKSTLVSSQPSASQPSASQPSGQVDKPSDKSELCEDGGDAPTCRKEVSDTPAPVQDSECHAPSTPGKNTEEVPPQKPQSEETDQCDEETDNTLTNEDIECNTSAETVKEEEEPTGGKMGKDENLEESSQKMKESPPQKTEDKSDNSSDQKVDVEQEAPLKDPECLPLPSTDSISASTDVSKTVDKTQDNSIQNISKEDENKNGQDEGGIGVESTKQSSACRDNQREIITKEETVKEKENVTEMKNGQNGAEDNAVEETYKTDETVVNTNTTTETKNEQNTPKKTVLAEALLLKDDTKPEEKDENLMLKELISKTKLAQPNQAGDFLDTRTLVDKPPIILKSSVEERDKKADREYEPDKFELRKKERLLLEEKHVHLADKEVRVDNVAATDKEFAEPFDLSGSQGVKERMVMTSQGDSSRNSSSRMERD
ncbi:hypothetical protein ACOMHN_066059 [Nucella lapillus]